MPFSWICSQVLTTEPTLLHYRPPWPPPHITGIIQQPGSPPTSLHGKGHAGHTTCYLRKIWWIPETGQAQSNYTPGETQRICWTLLEWHSCLQVLVRIHSRVHLESRNVFEVHNSRVHAIVLHYHLGMNSSKTRFHPAVGTTKENSPSPLICEKSCAGWLQTSKVEDARQVFT